MFFVDDSYLAVSKRGFPVSQHTKQLWLSLPTTRDIHESVEFNAINTDSKCTQIGLKFHRAEMGWFVYGQRVRVRTPVLWWTAGSSFKAPSHQASASTDGYVPQHFGPHATSMLSVHKPITFTHRWHWWQYTGPVWWQCYANADAQCEWAFRDLTRARCNVIQCIFQDVALQRKVVCTPKLRHDANATWGRC